MIAVFEIDEEIDGVIYNTCREIGINEETENVSVGIMSVFYHNTFFDKKENVEKVRKYKKS